MMNKNFDIDKCIEILKNGELIKETDIKIICAKVREIFVEEGNVQRIESPVTVCGDIHGQLFDFLEMVRIGGPLPETNYLLLGNYVNRGFHSIETLSLLYCLKIKFPDRITLLRGNHESRIITQVFGLYDESIRKYGSLNIWRYITETFEYLTISALIDNKIFCVHGGIAEEAKSLDDIRLIDRVKEVPQKGIMNDLLWSDPDENLKLGWQENPRGSGKVFGEENFQDFLHSNNLDKIIRGHQIILEGHRFIWQEQLLTVWSAPNYCYRCGNVASIATVSDKLQLNFKTFQAVNDQIKGAKQKIQNTLPDYFL